MSYLKTKQLYPALRSVLEKLKSINSRDCCAKFPDFVPTKQENNCTKIAAFLAMTF